MAVPLFDARPVFRSALCFHEHRGSPHGDPARYHQELAIKSAALAMLRRAIGMFGFTPLCVNSDVSRDSSLACHLGNCVEAIRRIPSEDLFAVADTRRCD